MSLRTFITNNKSKQKTLYKNYNESQFGDRLKAMNGVGKIFILFLSRIIENYWILLLLLLFVYSIHVSKAIIMYRNNTQQIYLNIECGSIVTTTIYWSNE